MVLNITNTLLSLFLSHTASLFHLFICPSIFQHFAYSSGVPLTCESWCLCQHVYSKPAWILALTALTCSVRLHHEACINRTWQDWAEGWGWSEVGSGSGGWDVLFKHLISIIQFSFFLGLSGSFIHFFKPHFRIKLRNSSSNITEKNHQRQHLKLWHQTAFIYSLYG